MRASHVTTVPWLSAVSENTRVKERKDSFLETKKRPRNPLSDTVWSVRLRRGLRSVSCPPPGICSLDGSCRAMWSVHPSVVRLSVHIEIRFYEVGRDRLLIQGVGGLRRREETDRLSLSDNGTSSAVDFLHLYSKKKVHACLIYFCIYIFCRKVFGKSKFRTPFSQYIQVSISSSLQLWVKHLFRNVHMHTVYIQ